MSAVKFTQKKYKMRENKKKQKKTTCLYQNVHSIVVLNAWKH